MKNLLLTISGKKPLSPPKHRTISEPDEWVEFLIPIGSDETCYITMPNSAYAELLKTVAVDEGLTINLDTSVIDALDREPIENQKLKELLK